MEVLRFPEIRLKKEGVVYQIPLDKIRPNPYQSRRYFHRHGLEELADSILAYGVLQPITVRKMSNGFYELVSGERRLRAAEIAGMATIPSILLHVGDRESALRAFMENIQRQNLSFLEEAEGYRNLMEDYGLTQEDLARMLCKSQSAIANKLRVLKLEESIKWQLVENGFTERHARALLRLPNEDCRQVVMEYMIEGDLNVKRTEELVAETLEIMRERPNTTKARKEIKEKRFVTDFRLITNTIKQSVDIIRRSGVDVIYEDNENENVCEIKIHITKMAAGEIA